MATSFKPDSIGSQTASFFLKNGFLVVEEALSQTDVDQMLVECVSICRGERGKLESGAHGLGHRSEDRITEENDSRTDEAVMQDFLCIHNPHKVAPYMLKSLSHPSLQRVLVNVIGPNVKCMQSMLFIKAAGKPGQAWHQDEDYIPTRDRSLCGAWIALDDATVENGCLWVIPGSHKPGILWPQFPHDDPRFDCALESYDFPYNDDDAIPVEVKAGSVIFFNGYLLHRSLPNRTESGFRRSLVNHYMSAESFLPWYHQEGVQMAKQDTRDIVMVAGKDPYAWKGLDEVSQAHIRPAGQGGCGDGRESLKKHRERPGRERAVF